MPSRVMPSAASRSGSSARPLPKSARRTSGLSGTSATISTLAGFEILVQHADRVRRRQRIRDACDQLDAYRARHRDDAAACLAPLGEIAAGDVFGFDEIRRFFDVPVEDAHDRRMLAETVAQQAVEGDLAFQRLQAATVAREFENSALVRLLMLDQPHGAETARTELAYEMPVRPRGQCVAGARLR